MTRKKKCVECRHCDMVVDLKNGSKYRCACKKRVLASNRRSRPACDRFEPPKPTEHWGP